MEVMGEVRAVLQSTFQFLILDVIKRRHFRYYIYYNTHLLSTNFNVIVYSRCFAKNNNQKNEVNPKVNNHLLP